MFIICGLFVYLTTNQKAITMKKITICLFLAITIMTQSCALIFSGRRDKVKIKAGAPDNARVYYNGEQVGTGDCTVKVNKKSIDNAVIEVKADGYETQTFRFSRKLKLGALILDCCCGFVPLIFDFSSGAIYKAKPQKVHYDLHASNSSIQTDFKVGDKVVFSYEDYKNVEGEIKVVYPNRAIIKYVKKNGKEVELEVPLINVAKK